MMRIDGMRDEILSPENIYAAARHCVSTRSDKGEVAEFLKDPETKLQNLRESLLNRTFVSSEYNIFERMERGKLRQVCDLPLYPDRIAHEAVMRVVDRKIDHKFIAQTHASRKGHGTHSAVSNVKRYLDRDPRIKFALKMDVRKFFQSLSKRVVMRVIADNIKDHWVVWFLYRCLDDFPMDEMPLGMRFSPTLANMVLSIVDHRMKEVYHVHYYVRYMDDVIILGYSKAWLRKIKDAFAAEIGELGLSLKGNWQIFPIESRGIDFVGYVIYPTHILLRKSTKQNLKKAVSGILKELESGKEDTDHMRAVVDSYRRVLKWCDSHYLYLSTIGKVDELLEQRERERIGFFAFRALNLFTQHEVFA